MENTIEICRSELLKIFEDLGQGDREKAKHLMRAMRIPWGSLERLTSSSDFANIFMNHSDSVDVCKERVKFILNKIPRRDLTLQNADFFTKSHIQKSEDKKQKCVPDERDSSLCYSGSCDQTIRRLSRQVKELETKIDSLTLASNSPSDRVHHFQSRSTSEELKGGEWQNIKVDTNHKETSSLQELKQRQSMLETTISTYREMVDLLKNQVNCYSTTMNNLQLERLHDKERLDSMERKLKHLENIAALNDVSLAEQRLSISLLESVSYDGVLLWKITDFLRRREDANNGRLLSIYSPYFFSSRHGYKMCARIYLNGDGMGKFTHISLFFVVMKGPYDAILKWPFPYKVTLTLIDQGSKHRTDVKYSFRPDPRSCSFQRPTSDMNIAVGCPLFMPLSRLWDYSHGYIKDDVVFVKVTVDTCTSAMKNFIMFRIFGFVSRSAPQNEEDVNEENLKTISYLY